MSGSRILIAADVDGVIIRLVDAAGTIASADLGPWALVGGLAVMVQLAEAHRVTADIDAAADNDEGKVDAALDVLVADGRAHRVLDQLYVGVDTKVEVIPVGTWDPKELPDDDLDRVFVIAHSWAVTSAVVTDVRVTGADGAIVTEATFPIATPASLVAAKLQSHQNRKRRDEKKASDVYDIYRLLREHDHDRGDGIAETLATAPEDLAAWCADAIESSLVTSSARWARQLGVYNRGPAMGSVTAEDLEVVGSLAVERLRRQLRVE